MMSTKTVTLTEQHGKEVHTETHTDRNIDLGFGIYLCIAFYAVCLVVKAINSFVRKRKDH